MKDPKAIRKAIMTARNIAAMVDPNFARVPLPQIGEPDAEEMRPPRQFAIGGPVLSAYNAAKKADYGMHPESGRAVEDFIGVPPDAFKTKVWGGIMNADPLEDAYSEQPSEKGSMVRQQLKEQFDPIRENLREIFGDHVTLYRHQGEVAGQNTGQRNTLSWSIDPKVAHHFAGVRPKPFEGYPEEEISRAEQDMERSGEAKIGNYHFVRNKEYPEYMDFYKNGDHITDTDSIRKYFEDHNNYVKELNDKNENKKASVVKADVPLDDIVWASNRAGQREFIVHNRPDAPHFIDINGKMPNSEMRQFSMGGRLPAQRSDNPFEQFQSQDPFSFDLPDHNYASGGGVDDHVVNNPMSVFPKPQRMWEEEMPGGAYLSMPDKADVTGHRAAQASIGIGEGGRPYFNASRDEVDETGSPGKGSALVKTNLFKQKAGWRWMNAPEGHEGTGTIVSVEHRGKHHYVMDAHFPKGVELSRYADAPSEPRLRPTTRGNVELGPQVGSILVRGREHPVHSHAIVREYGGRVGYADGGMPDTSDLTPMSGDDEFYQNPLPHDVDAWTRLHVGRSQKENEGLMRRTNAAHAAAHEEVLPISNLIGIEDKIGKRALHAPSSELPFVEHSDGKFYVRDGNHRVVSEYLKGNKSIKVRLADLDAFSHLLHRADGGRTGYADGGMPDDEQPTDYSAPNDMGLYSHGAATAASAPQAKASPEEFRSMLTNRGVKPSEFQASGYDEAFAGQPQVTREQVAEHFHQNRTPIEEKGFYTDNPNYESSAALEREYGKKFHDLFMRKLAYREANPGVDTYKWGDEENDALQAELKQKRTALRDRRKDIVSAGTPHHEEFMLPGGENYREIALKHGGDDVIFKGVSGHLGGEKNILTHVLMKDRTDSEGKRLLHLDELQSDWAQQGREKGFENPNLQKYNEYVSDLSKRFAEKAPDYFREQGDSEEDIERGIRRYQTDPASMAHILGETDKHNSLVDAADFTKSGVIKPAPYVTKTDDWVDLGLKRAMMEAAKGGHDKLAWSPGDVVADRYNLSKHISNIHHEKNDDGTYNVMAYNHDGARVYDQDELAEKDVVDALGKEVAGKIFSGEGVGYEEAQARRKNAEDAHINFKKQLLESEMQSRLEALREKMPESASDEDTIQMVRDILESEIEKKPGYYAQKHGVEDEHEALSKELKDAYSATRNSPHSPYRDWRTLSGLDLTVGGEGMKKFYNEMLPKRLMKLAKQHDPDAKFSTSTVTHPKEYYEDEEGGNTHDYMPNVETDLPTLEMTPKMRESILKKGFAAYADGGEVEGYAAGGDVDGYQDPATQHISGWNWRPVEDVQESLGGMKEIPSHVEKFGDFMDNIAQRAAGSGLTPRDLIKAYTITRSSIQRQAADVNKLRASGLDLPEEMTGKIRPEGAFGEWLHTPAGQAYLDAAEKGKVHQTAIRNAIQVMAPFGRHQTDIPDALTWAALNLPGKEKQVSELVHAGHLMASTPEEWRAFTQHIRGVGPSKSGFLASLMGRGDQPTLDARQIILHTGRPTKEASKYIAKKGGAGGVEAVDRLAARQSAMDLSLPDRLKPYYQHLAHHAVWDKAGNDETTHEDVVRAMHHAAKGGAQNAYDQPNMLQHPVTKIFQAIGMAGLNDASVDPEKFKEYLQRAQHALARKITTKGSDVLASNPGAANVTMSKFGKPLEEMESTALQKGMMLPRKEADLEEMQRRGSRIFPFLGDLSPADQILLKSGQTSLTDPSEQQGGSDFMRSEFAKGSDPAAYGNRIGAAKTLAKKIASQTPEGTPAIGTHVAMGLGSVDSSHHAYEPILRMIPNSPIQQKHIDEFDDMMREALPPTKQHPSVWPGIMNTKEAEQFFASRPGTHASFFTKKIDSSKWQKAGFPDIGEVRFSASTPELLGAPRLSTGHAFSQVEPSGRVISNPDLKHKTYPALIPSEGEGYLGGSSIPIPAKLMFNDFYKTMKTKDRSGKAIDYDSPSGQTLFQQSLMTKVPYQDATQEWLDGIMEDRRQKQEQGFKKGGKVRGALMIAKGLKKR